MISVNGVEYIKAIAELQADIIPGGVIFLLSDGNTYTWRKASSIFDLNIFQVGEKLNPNSITGKAMNENKTLIEVVPRSLYGVRLKIIADPIVDDSGKAVGVFSTVFPIVHPLMKAFNDFAPVLSKMFSDGVVLMTTDLEKIATKQASSKFDISAFKVGDAIDNDSIAAQVIKSQKPISKELDASVFGVPVLESCYPLFNEETNEIVATFLIILPKTVAVNLREMSFNLESGISGIVASIEQLAASASTIHTNEQELNDEIKDITDLSEEINNISSFIKQISNETKMLGLNASIEAARAGEAGRGFGVVAKEIRKLSDQSKSTVPKIQNLTNLIKSKVNGASIKSQNSLASSQEQAAATEEITSSIEELSSMSEKLTKIAKRL